MPDDPDGVPYPQACDALKLVGLEGHAAAHARIPDLEARLERAVAFLEGETAQQMYLHGPGEFHPGRVALISEHRGETPEATLARLRPPPPATWAEPGDEPWNMDLPRQDEYLDRLRSMDPAERDRMMFGRWDPVAPPPDDSRAAIRRTVDDAVSREARELESFLVANHADPERHEHVIYPAPEGFPGGARLHVLIPREELRGRSVYPRDEAMARHPWRVF